jgi:hypothetical protein
LVTFLLWGWVWTVQPLRAVELPLAWRWSNPLPHGNHVYDLAFVNGVYLEVTDFGQMYASQDLTLWTRLNSPVTNALRSVTLFGAKIIVTGENGTVLQGYSTTGLDLISLGTTDWLEGVTGSPDLLVAVGDNAAIYTSTDGVTWQRQAVPFANWLRSIAYGSGVFVAVGEGGFISTSADGVTWQVGSSGTTVDLNDVVWLRDRFYVAGSSAGTSAVLLSSPSGRDWESVSPGATGELFATASVDDTLLVAGDREVRTRTGVLWIDELSSGRPAPPPLATYYAAVGGGGRFVISGRNGVGAEGFRTSALGSWCWRDFSLSVRTWLWDVTRTSDLYIAVGDLTTIMTSGDGIDWYEELVPGLLTNTVLLGVGGNTNLTLAVGSGGQMVFSPYALEAVISTNTVGTNVVVSTNLVNTMGLLWYPVAPRPTNNDLQGVAGRDNLLVVSGGGGTILTSTNGTNWVLQVAPTTDILSSVASFPGGWVAVGDNGTLLFSSDAKEWRRQPSGTTNWVYRVRYLGGRLVAVGQGGTILTSANGLDWTKQASGTTRWLNDVAFVDGTYFVVGNNGTVLASTNGLDWLSIGMITGNALFGAAVHQGQLVVVGIGGSILRAQITPKLDPVAIHRYDHTVTNGVARDHFLFAGKPDQLFVLESTTELTTWETENKLELSDSTGTLYWVRSSTNLQPRQFFRTRLMR